MSVLETSNQGHHSATTSDGTRHDTDTICFFGLGAMGGGIAANLVQNGYTVHGYDTYKPSIDRFARAGGHKMDKDMTAVASAMTVISMVATAAQNDDLLFNSEKPLLPLFRSGATFMLCSTCPPDYALSLREKFDQRGRSDVKLLDCPVSGGTVRAANGTLSLFVAGQDEDMQDASPLLEAMSRLVYRMGPIPNGSKTKTVHQLLAATNIISASEAMGLAATVGLNTRAVYEHVKSSDGTSFMFDNRAPHMLDGDWHPYSALGIILKDTKIVCEVARAESFNAPMAFAAEQQYLKGVDHGLLKDDDARLVQLYLSESTPNAVAECTQADVMMIRSHQVDKNTIADMLEGIHLAASMECMAFCKKLGIDRQTMCDIVSQAAGSSAAFVKYVPTMLEKDSWTLANCDAASAVQQKLAAAVDRCQKLKYACPMAMQALQQFSTTESGT